MTSVLRWRGLWRLAVPLLVVLAMVGGVPPAPAAAADPVDFPVGYTGYHTYDEMTAQLKATVRHYGRGAHKIVKLYDIGTSFEGRTIWAIKISDNVTVDEQEPEVLAECNMHAREHLTAEMCLYMVQLLTDNYGKSTALGQRVTADVNSHEIWIIPMLNPDGAMYDISDGVFHGWRKNRQVLPGTSKVGIDLNRNWSYKWGCCGGSSPKPGSARYRGTYPFEATEDQVLRDFILSRRIDGVQQIKTIFNWHSTGQHVLWPFGYTKEDIPLGMSRDDHSAFVAMGTQMAALNGYKPEQGSDMYIYDGAFIDWAYGDQGIFAFTFEMYPSFTCGKCGGFHPPDSVLTRETVRNTDTTLYFIEQADCPYRQAGLAGKYCA